MSQPAPGPGPEEQPVAAAAAPASKLLRGGASAILLHAEANGSLQSPPRAEAHGVPHASASGCAPEDRYAAARAAPASPGSPSAVLLAACSDPSGGQGLRGMTGAAANGTACSAACASPGRRQQGCTQGCAQGGPARAGSGAGPGVPGAPIGPASLRGPGDQNPDPNSGPASASAGVAEDAAGRVLRKRKHRCAGPGLRLSGLSVLRHLPQTCTRACAWERMHVCA